MYLLNFPVTLRVKYPWCHDVQNAHLRFHDSLHFNMIISAMEYSTSCVLHKFSSCHDQKIFSTDSDLGCNRHLTIRTLLHTHTHAHIIDSYTKHLYICCCCCFPVGRKLNVVQEDEPDINQNNINQLEWTLQASLNDTLVVYVNEFLFIFYNVLFFNCVYIDAGYIPLHHQML